NGSQYTVGGVIDSIVAGSRQHLAGSSAILLNTPSGVFADGAGHIYVADAGNHRIQKFTAGNPNGVTVAGTGTAGNGASQLNGPT
ncbi:hypothetical protein ACE4Z7_25075, partial [Salmonella enterica]|uniref:hypothetical protein n=1 Tax=Salmonella enterica TaxID=28901 RepID=UPI003D2E5839